MTQLTIDQIRKIKEILDRIFKNRKEDEDRSDLLEMCGVENVIGAIRISKSHENFIISLCNLLCKTDEGESENRPLTVFLQNYQGLGVNPPLKDSDLEFIQSLEKKEEKTFPKTDINQGEPVGRELISDFDIRDLVDAFNRPLKVGEGVFGFSLGGFSPALMQEWFLNRMIREFRQNYSKTFSFYDIYLQPDHAGNDTILQELIKEETGVNLSEWPDLIKNRDFSRDTLISVWNSKIAFEEFQPMVESFWKSLAHLPFEFKGANGFLIFIWLNCMHPAVDIEHPGFFVLPVEDPLRESTVKRFIRKLEQDLKQKEDSLLNYRNKMKKLGYGIEDIYAILGQIVTSKQGALTQHV